MQSARNAEPTVRWMAPSSSFTSSLHRLAVLTTTSTSCSVMSQKRVLIASTHQPGTPLGVRPTLISLFGRTCGIPKSRGPAGFGDLRRLAVATGVAPGHINELRPLVLYDLRCSGEPSAPLRPVRQNEGNTPEEGKPDYAVA
jgi:hypothetical protein